MGPAEQPFPVRSYFIHRSNSVFLFPFVPPFSFMHLLCCILSFSTLLYFDSSLFSFSFFAHLPSLCFINQWVVLLYGSWDQIRFTLGLNACSHGLLHLKANSFSWNFAVQFERRLMLANFTPPLFQNVSSIAHINC